MKILGGIFLFLIVVGVALYVERLQWADYVETFAAERIHEAIHDKNKDGTTDPQPSFIKTVGKGIGQKLVKLEIGSL